ncbi:MAG: NADH-quinone oxidoreductase subunit NuoE [Thermoflexales bacterium]
MLREKRAQDIEKVLAKYPPERRRSAVMPLLYIAQEEYGYCTPEAIREVAEIIGCDPTEVKSIVGFYTMFHEQPVGKYVIDVCDDLPCALRGADKFVSHCEKKLGIRVGETTPDGKFTLNTVMCIAACDRAPVLQINKQYRYALDEQTFDRMIDELP